jgi:hypothetical protein
MDRRLRGWTRPALVLGVLGVVATALVASPVGAHFNPPDEKKHVKKIARRIARKEARTIVQTTVGPTIFIEETELTRFGQIKVNTGAADQVVATVGPLSVKARCEVSAGDVRATLFVNTTENNSAFYSNYWGDENDFDASETDTVYWIQWTGDVPGGAAEIATGGNQMHFLAPGGTSVEGIASIATNFAGSHCVFEGYLFQTTPSA